MRYIISDIHGCYEEYMKLLENIGFSDNDKLYILGDAMDRGPESIKVIEDIMQRKNVVFILGNHEYMMLVVMNKLAVEVTEENFESHLSVDDLLNYQDWINNGGELTSKQFLKLTYIQQQRILEFIKNALLYEVIEEKGIEYVLVHAGISDFKEEKSLLEYDFEDFIYERADYSKQYFKTEKKILVTGHTPTMLIREDKAAKVFIGNNHIAIDCGVVFGGNLAAYCIETGEATYVKSKNETW